MTPEQEKVIKELAKYGMDWGEPSDNPFHFICKGHPYKEETIPQQTRQELFNKLGNIVTYDAGTKKLIIKEKHFTVGLHV